MARLKTRTAHLAQKHCAGIYQLLRRDLFGQLETFVSQGFADRSGDPVHLDDSGIVPRVARTLLSYAIGNVQNEPVYNGPFKDARSKQTAPVVAEDEDGQATLLAVINQESTRPAQYHAASVEMLRQVADVELKTSLRVLEELGSRKVDSALPCAWNACRFGWGLRIYLMNLLQLVKEELQDRGFVEPGRNDLHLTIWYVDQDDCVLSTIASTGFSDGVNARELLGFDDPGMGVLGQLATRKDWATVTWSPGSTVDNMHWAVQTAMGTVRVAPDRVAIPGRPKGGRWIPDHHPGGCVLRRG